MTRKRRWRLGLCSAMALILLPVLWYGWLAIRIAAYSWVSATAPADAAVVLGNAIDDGRPTPVFQGRIDHAVRLYRAGTVRVIIFTGGVPGGETMSESEVARDYAIEQGVSAEHVRLERVSKTTWQNLREAKKIIVKDKLGPVLIVSDPLHMRRAMTMARDLGLDAYPCPTTTSRFRTWRTKVPFLLREAFFYATYLIDRALGGRD